MEAPTPATWHKSPHPSKAPAKPGGEGLATSPPWLEEQGREVQLPLEGLSRVRGYRRRRETPPATPWAARDGCHSRRGVCDPPVTDGACQIGSVFTLEALTPQRARSSALRRGASDF